MNRFEKIAWYNLAVLTVFALLFLFLFFHVNETLPLSIRFKASLASFGVIGFIGIGPMIFKKKAVSDDEDVIVGDERDLSIQRRAQTFCFRAFWFVLVFGVMLLWIYLRFISPEGRVEGTMTIPLDVDFIPMMLLPGAVILIAASALSTILQYRNLDFGGYSYEDGASRKTIIKALAFFLFFIAFWIFMLSFMSWVYAVKVLAVLFASGYSMVRSLRYNPGGDYTAGDIRLLTILEWVMCGLFIVFFTASTATVILDVIESRAMSRVITRLFIVGFGAMIFALSLFKYRDKHPLEDNHEQA